ncbi:MAG: cytidylate kinase-like family protein [Ignavibacteriaceae bacterium]|nr:cytidylate kinase-like family protein [Ignavibacteria bacterium]NNJ54378.1 cytidylate kinase-like family protein [Ignavibacteriaceae bacterium]NNL21690.1 cytidylate kinase-like family protein [Ignavibacteriaceae bacterium]
MIAEILAERLGYECVSREILLKASKEFNIPEVVLNHAMYDAPSFLDRIKHGKKKYIAFIRRAFLEYIQKDNIVYHGLAGQFLTSGLFNVLKVRITANMNYRVVIVQNRDNVDEEKARQILQSLDEARKKWSMYLYGIDSRSPELYDVVLHVDCIEAEHAADILYKIANRPCFQTTSESKRKLKDMIIAAQAYSMVADKFPNANVKCENGVLLISVESSLSAERALAKNFNKLLKNIEGVKEVKTYMIPFET